MPTEAQEHTRIHTQIRVYLMVEDLQRQFAAYLGTPDPARGGYPPYAGEHASSWRCPPRWRSSG